MAWSFYTSNWCFASSIHLLSSQAICQIPFLMYIYIVFCVSTPLTVVSGASILEENTVFIFSQSVNSEDGENSFICNVSTHFPDSRLHSIMIHQTVIIWTFTSTTTWPQTFYCLSQYYIFHLLIYVPWIHILRGFFLKMLYAYLT